MKKKIIEKIKIQLLSPEEEVRGKYNKARAEFIVKYGHEYTFWGKRPRPDIGEADWNKLYPNGFNDWVKSNAHRVLTSIGQQSLIDKINEIIDYLYENKKAKKL